MDFDLSSLPSSTLGIVGAVVLAVLALVSRHVNRKSEQNADLERQLSEVEEALRLALEDGRVTDAKRLSDRLYELRRRLGRRTSCR